MNFFLNKIYFVNECVFKRLWVLVLLFRESDNNVFKLLRKFFV